MGSPVQLQCLCHKTIEATTAGEFYKPATGGVVKAKLSCNGASVKAGLVASASIAAPAIPRRGINATLTTTAEVSSILSGKIALTSQANEVFLTKSYSECTGSGPYYKLTVDGASSEELFRVGMIGKITDVNNINIVRSVYSYEVTKIDGDFVTVKYLSDSNSLGDASPCDLCSLYSEGSTTVHETYRWLFITI